MQNFVPNVEQLLYILKNFVIDKFLIIPFRYKPILIQQILKMIFYLSFRNGNENNYYYEYLGRLSFYLIFIRSNI